MTFFYNIRRQSLDGNLYPGMGLAFPLDPGTHSDWDLAINWGKNY